LPNDYLDQVQVGGTTYDLQDTAAQEDLSQLKSQITQKANANGAYDEMTVGSAEQLLSANGLTDKVPYLFRRSGGAGANRAREQGIVGGTIAWNQLVDPVGNNVTGLEITVNSNGSYHFSGTAAGGGGRTKYISNVMSIVAGHKYLMLDTCYDIFADVYLTNTTTNDNFKAGSLAATGVAKRITNSEYTGQFKMGLNMSANSDKNCDGFIGIYDLTQALTPAVADYVYNLENATAGAGVAKLKSWGLFIKDYYEYDAGSLQSVQVAAKQTVGFNVWDEEWEVGGLYNATGLPWATSDRIRSKNYIPILPDTVYVSTIYFNALCFYDANKNYISGNSLVAKTFTSPSNAYFIKFAANAIYGTTYNHDICINLSDPTRNGEYAPYESHTYPLDSSLTLRGIPELDADNNLRYNGDVYKPDGTVERRFGIVDLGTLTYGKSSLITNGFVATAGMPSDFPIAPGTLAVPNWVCGKYQVYTNQGIEASGVDKAIAWRVANQNKGIIIRDSAYASIYDPFDGTAFASAMSGIYLVYEKDVPTTETADPYQETQLLDPYGTEEYIDAAVTAATPTRDVAIPVGHETYYPENAAEKLAGLPWDFSTLIANTEKGFTATKPYSVNDFLIVNNQLYRVTASIANGATITPNTNVTATTLGAQITALLNA